MDLKVLAGVVSILALGAGAAWSAEVTGGEFRLNYSTFTGSPMDQLDATSISGAIEVGIARQFAVQGDAGLVNFGYSGADSSWFTLHGIHHVNESTSLGAFVGREELEGEGSTYYGIEIGQEFGQLKGEAYLATFEESGEDSTLFGMGADYAVNDSFSFGLSHDRLDIAGEAAHRTALRGAYAMGNASVTAEIGSRQINGIGSETFVGIRFKTTFGAARGATFDRRSLTSLIPGL
ncbi:hypothetical protein LV82_01580 [Albidovulum inexpectatum]|uniref:Porin-like protein n=1 Tax=Albidovulum inexpectatum TaxID=196587 RepID=A0A2S5JH48_9RHOB|nr:hypothetical protein [Albidovulum inexpectatum]PPB80847.1 hypothetical protein LV82_01580 [Albidovulum inexpectatum]